MNTIANIELALNDIRTAANQEREFAKEALRISVANVDALIQNHTMALKLLEEHREQLIKTCEGSDAAIAAVIGDQEGTNER